MRESDEYPAFQKLNAVHTPPGDPLADAPSPFARHLPPLTAPGAQEKPRSST